MRILYDGHIYALQVTGGISRYFANLIAQLPTDLEPILTTYQRPDHTYPRHANLKVIPYRAWRFRPSRLAYWWSDFAFQQRIAREPVDLWHPTYYTLMANQAIAPPRAPLVLTVHDLLHERFAAQMDPTGFWVAQKRQAILAADALICVSEHTRRDLLEYYPVDPGRVRVIYEAGSLSVADADPEAPTPNAPYYLYVGNRNPAYKNFDRLLVALANLRSLGYPIQLGIVGPPATPEEAQQVGDLQLEEALHWLGFVGDRHLAHLYRQSLALVYPSRYEGFGIPPLEAMACGTAVISANTASLPEVVGDAALLFDPDSTDDLTAQLLALAQDSALRTNLIARGQAQVQHFSWQRAAAQTLEVYQSLCKT